MQRWYNGEKWVSIADKSNRSLCIYMVVVGVVRSWISIRATIPHPCHSITAKLTKWSLSPKLTCATSRCSWICPEASRRMCLRRSSPSAGRQSVKKNNQSIKCRLGLSAHVVICGSWMRKVKPLSWWRDSCRNNCNRMASVSVTCRSDPLASNTSSADTNIISSVSLIRTVQTWFKVFFHPTVVITECPLLLNNISSYYC